MHKTATTTTLLILLLGGLLVVQGCSSSGGGSDSWDDHTQGLPFVFGYEKGLEQARQQNKPVMLFVTTTWCGWCKKLANDCFNDPEIKKLLTENFVCVIVDGDTEKTARSQLGVRGYPHIIFQSTGGETLAEQEGYSTASQFRGVVEQAMRQTKA